MKTKETSLTPRNQMQEKLGKIHEQLKSIKAESEQQWKTNGQFQFTPGHHGATTIIHNTSSIEVLLNILGFLISKSESYNKAAEELGLREYPLFVWLSFPLDAWKHDISVRISQLTHSKKIAMLKQAQAELESFMTEDDRLARVLEKLNAMGI